MAVTNCTECGEPVSDKARTCPHCGYARLVTIYIVRERRYTGSGLKIKIEVDGNEVTSLGGNESIEFDLPAGAHHFKVSSSRPLGLGENVGTSTTINIKGGETYKFIVRFDGMMIARPKLFRIRD